MRKLWILFRLASSGSNSPKQLLASIASPTAGPIVNVMSGSLHSTVKDKLNAGEVVSSMTVRLVPSVEIVQVIKLAGFDSFYIDLEHSPFSIETTNQIATMALAAV